MKQEKKEKQLKKGVYKCPSCGRKSVVKGLCPVCESKK